MSAKLFVGNLPFSVTGDDLKTKFSSYGTVSEAVVISDKFSHRSKGFGFVTFEEEESAKKAVAELDGKDFQGREIKVNEAKPMEERSSDDRPRRSFGGDRGGSRGGGFGGDRGGSRGGGRSFGGRSGGRDGGRDNRRDRF
jgi:cold-inducible RNA-binding protein